MTTPQKVVFLDRDGTLTRSLMRDGTPVPPESLADFELFPDAFDSLHHLRNKGFKLIVVTNQPDVSRGTADKSTIEAMNHQLMQWLPLDAIHVCYHDDKDACKCRKPLPGLLLQTTSLFPVDFTHSWMVGDRWRDISAGKAAGCRTVFIDWNYSEKLRDQPDFTVASLKEAVEIILQNP